jgi:SPP1 family predicted phage head-tail adaptor
MTDTRIGELRQRMRLEVAVRTPDGAGGADETWSLVAELWASLKPLSGQEGLEADRVAGHVTHDVVVRYRAGMVPAMRLVLGTRVFDIRAVLDVDERRRFLRCLVEERDI